jgi:hypothetical protein
MEPKMKTTLKDRWKQDIKLGDAVVQVGIDSWYPDTPYVVTREGSAENLQVNGGSYVKASSLIVVTQQYIHLKGQTAYDELVSKYELIEKPVESKLTVKYKVAHDSYQTKKFFVIPVIGNNDKERVQNAKMIADRMQLTARPSYGVYYFEGSTYKKAGVYIGYGAKPISMKALKELGTKVGVDFVSYIEQEITDPKDLAILNNLPKA